MATRKKTPAPTVPPASTVTHEDVGTAAERPDVQTSASVSNEAPADTTATAPVESTDAKTEQPESTVEPAKTESSQAGEQSEEEGKADEGQSDSVADETLESDEEAEESDESGEFEDGLSRSDTPVPSAVVEATLTEQSGATGTSEEDADILEIGSESEVRHLPVGTRFYALFLHNPKSDDARWAEDHRADLIAGRVQRRNLPSAYWEFHSRTHAPLALRTANGYTVIQYNPPEE